MLIVCSLNIFVGKPLVSRTTSTLLVLVCFYTFNVILDFLLYNI
jgi:hypothetical protein